MKNPYDYCIVEKNPTVYFHHWDGEILKVKIIACDFDKRVVMLTDSGEEIEYKWGYVYNTYADALAAKNYDWENDTPETVHPNCINVYKLLLSNKNYNLFKKLRRKEDSKQTDWYVGRLDDSYTTSKKFKRLKEALRYFKEEYYKHKDFFIAERNTFLDFVEWEEGVLWLGREPSHKYKKFYRVAKSRHLGKEKTYKCWRK